MPLTGTPPRTDFDIHSKYTHAFNILQACKWELQKTKKSKKSALNVFNKKMFNKTIKYLSNMCT